MKTTFLSPCTRITLASFCRLLCVASLSPLAACYDGSDQEPDEFDRSSLSFEGGRPVALGVIDANEPTYMYAPEIIYDGGQYHFWACWGALAGHDWIVYKSSTTLAGLEGQPLIPVLAPDDGEVENCDPSVIKGDDGTWYLHYSINPVGYATSARVAHATSPAGPYTKYGLDLVGRYPLSELDEHQYGRGQTTVARGPDALYYMAFTNVIMPKEGPHSLIILRSSDPSFTNGYEEVTRIPIGYADGQVAPSTHLSYDSASNSFLLTTHGRAIAVFDTNFVYQRTISFGAIDGYDPGEGQSLLTDASGRLISPVEYPGSLLYAGATYGPYRGFGVLVHPELGGQSPITGPMVWQVYRPGTEQILGPPGRLQLAGPMRVFDRSVSDTRVETIRVTNAGLDTTDLLGAVLNIVVENPTSPGFARVWADGDAEPGTTSDINYLPGETRTNLILTHIGSSGLANIRLSSGSARVVVDVVGLFASSGTLGFLPVAPGRVLDTRNQPGPIPPNSSLEVDLGTPASAAVLSVTALDASVPGYLAVYPSEAGYNGSFSSLNYNIDQTIANQVWVQPNGGKITIYNGGGSPVQVIIDVNAAFDVGSNAGFIPLTSPVRAYDTRTSDGTPLAENSSTPLSFAGAGVPGWAIGLSYNLTIIEPSTDSFAALYASDPWPGTSIINIDAGGTVASGGVVAMGQDQLVRLYNGGGAANMAMDVTGYFANP